MCGVFFGLSYLHCEFAGIKYTQTILTKGHIVTCLYVGDKPKDKPLCVFYIDIFNLQALL